MPQPIKTIITHPHFQIDTLAALALLAYFGEAKYPGIGDAPIKFMAELPPGRTAAELEERGILALDMGGGKFDHHRYERFQEKACLTDLVIKDLGLQNNPAVMKLRRYARRDDLYGKGTASEDLIDRAFGLSGLLQNLNRRYRGNPTRIVQIILPLLEAHLWEEDMRHTIFPEEYQKVKEEGRLQEFTVFQGKKLVRVVTIESDINGMAGFLRANTKIKADVVVQKLSSGHINIITNQTRRVDLKNLAALLRIEEARKKRLPFDEIPKRSLFSKGKVPGIEEWYYDTAANSLQNGGIRPENTPPTSLSLEEVKTALEYGLDPNKAASKYPKFFQSKL